MTQNRGHLEHRKLRGIALQVLYEYDASGHSPSAAIERLVVEHELGGEGRRVVDELVKGSLISIEDINQLIKKYAPAWPVDQIPLVDRNILRMAIFEMLYQKAAPRKVVINEAVELAKTFGSESSPRFVNGVLGSLVEDGANVKETVKLKRE